MLGVRWSYVLLALPLIASLLFIGSQTIWDNSYPTSDEHGSLTLPLLFLMPLSLYFY